mmetsp:Transcript_5838/g.12151  ORF Transcript_5838/g.12151 Transcript_5838/m.12151 type:complete len:105 (+) Transcript_5838:170-484(+)
MKALQKQATKLTQPQERDFPMIWDNDRAKLLQAALFAQFFNCERHNSFLNRLVGKSSSLPFHLGAAFGLRKFCSDIFQPVLAISCLHILIAKKIAACHCVSVNS